MFPRTACIIDSVNEYRKYRLLLFKAVHIGKIHNKSGIRSFRISIGRELPLASNNVYVQKRKFPFNFSFNCNFQKRVEIINFPELRFYQIIVSSRVSPPPRQNLKFSIPPQNDFSPGIFKSDFPPTGHFFVNFHPNLRTSNYDARAYVNWNFSLNPPWLEKILKFSCLKCLKTLQIVKNQTSPPRPKSENSNSSPKPFLPRHFEK